MNRRMHHSTPLWIASLACLIFGFVPLMVVGVTAGMELAWLLATDPTSLGWPSLGLATLAANALDQVVTDWGSLYMIDGQYDVRLLATQAICAALWCAYMGTMRWRLGER
jgi:hypothetical protein